MLPSRTRVIKLEFTATVELEDAIAELQARAFAEYISREINFRSINPQRRESFKVSAVELYEPESAHERIRGRKV